MRDLFRQVSDPHSTVGGSRLSALPVSIAVHVAVLVVVVVIPLLATDILPAVRLSAGEFQIVSMPQMPSPPPALRPASAAPVPAVNPNAAPVEPPMGVNQTGLEVTPAMDAAAPGPSGVVAFDVPPGITPGVIDAPPPSKPVAPVRVHTLLRPPVRLRDVAPVYPEIARTARVEGIVIIEAIINATGDVVEAKILRSVPLLDQAAVDAVRQWKYTPSLLNGVPVPVVMTVTVTFSLK